MKRFIGKRNKCTIISDKQVNNFFKWNISRTWIIELKTNLIFDNRAEVLNNQSVSKYKKLN